MLFQTKMFRLYSKMTIYGHFFYKLESIYFSLAVSKQKCKDYIEK